MKKLILIDSNALVHRAFHALPPTLSSPTGVPTNAVYGFTAVLLKMLRELKPDYIAAAFDLAGPTFRHEEFAEYKSHRPKGPDELYAQLPLAKDVVRAFGIPVYERQGYEADDIIGTLAEHARTHRDLKTIIVTGDLDTLQLVQDDRTVVFTLRKGVTDTVIYDEKAVKERYGLRPDQVVDFKGLKGDPSDNIPGVPGIGEKTASALIVKFGSIEKLYETLDRYQRPAKRKGKEKKLQPPLTEKLAERLLEHRDQALFSKKLSTIVRTLDVGFDLQDMDWRTNVRMDLLEKTLRDFGFASLIKRLPESIGAPSLPMEDAVAVAPQPITVHGTTVGHDLKLYLKTLIAEQKPLPEELFDTAVAAWLLNPDLKDYRYSEVWSSEFGSRPRGTADELTGLRDRLWEKLKSADLTHVFETIEMPLLPILAAMEQAGIGVDAKAIAVLDRSCAKELARLEKKIYELAGAPFNIGSPQQLSNVLFQTLGLKGKVRTTAGGALSTAAGELEKLRQEHPIVDLILDWREVAKLKSTYSEPFPTLLGRDGRIHTTYNQTGASTGRLASQDPNLQNIPTRTELGKAFRNAFIPAKGTLLVSFDYSQLELRIAAHLAGDATMAAIFKRGEDIHTRTAAEIFGVAPEEVTKDMRRQAKVLNFGIMYGMGTLGFARAGGVDRATARRFIDAYFKEFRGIADYMDRTKREAARDGSVRTLFGRKRFLPAITSPVPYIRAQAERMAINHPIQGTEADLIKLAMIAVDRYLRDRGLTGQARMLLQVHDELVFEIGRSHVPSIAPEIKRIMETVHELDVPLTVDVHYGTRWGTMAPLEKTQ